MSREDHAAYIGHWLGVMKGDKRAIFTVAAKASGKRPAKARAEVL